MSRNSFGIATVRWVAAGCVLACILASKGARAAPQFSSTLALGVAGNGDRSHLWTKTDVAAGLRGELLLGRNRDLDFGLGPFVDVLTTNGFSDAQLGGGATLLVPVHPYLPLTLSFGGYAGRSDGAWRPGISSELFWGSHGYNYDSLYALSAGIFVAGRQGLGDARDVSFVAGVRLDLELIALPAVLLWNAIRGGDPAR